MYIGTDELSNEWIQRMGGGEWIQQWVESLVRYGVEQELERVATFADQNPGNYTNTQVAAFIRNLDPWRAVDETQEDPRPPLNNAVPFPSRGG